MGLDVIKKDGVCSLVNIFDGSNYVHRVICKCGNKFNIKLNNNIISRENFFFFAKNTSTVCKKCEHEIKHDKNIQFINDSSNSNSTFMFNFEEDDNVSYISLNLYLKKYIKNKDCIENKKVDSMSLHFNKKECSFFFKNKKDKINNNNNYIFTYLDSITVLCHDWVYDLSKTKHGIFEYKEAENNINNFINSISTKINKSDFLAIKKLFDKEFERSTSLTHRLYLLIQLLSFCISMLYYPSLSTVFLTKGFMFYSNLISSNIFKSSNVLFNSDPKKTKPAEIIEQIIRNYLVSKEGNEVEVGHYKNKLKDFKITKRIYNSIAELRHLENIIGFMSLECITPKTITEIMNKYGVDYFYKVTGQFRAGYRYNNLIGDKELVHIFKITDKIETLDTKVPFFARKEVLRFDLNIYSNTIGLLQEFNIDKEEILKCKTWEEVSALHDDLFERKEKIAYELANPKISESIKNYISLSQTIDGISFKIIDSAEGLEKESAEMYHCVNTYANDLAHGRCIIFKIIDKETKDRATLEIGIQDNGNYVFFNQLKAKYNNRATRKIIESTIKFCKEFVKSDIDDYHINHGDLSFN